MAFISHFPHDSHEAELLAPGYKFYILARNKTRDVQVASALNHCVADRAMAAGLTDFTI